MPYDKARAKAIKDLQTSLENDVGGKERLHSAKIMVKGVAIDAPIYKFPLGQLLYNKSNGRVRSEIYALEAELGRSIDEENIDDQKRIKGLILAIREDENEKIKEDLKKNGQLQPGIMTCDGVVINGNRRKALLEKLYELKHEEKFKYLEVHVLPSTITKSEIWLIEAGIQLSAPQQLVYSPINNLLKLREGVNSGIKVPEMATRIYGMSEDSLNEDLKRLKLMDEYLDDYIGKSGRYYLLDRKNEHFINLQNILEWIEHPRGGLGLKDWDPDESDISELKVVAFHYIRVGFKHMRIRELRDQFICESSWKELRKSLDITVEINDADRQEGSGITNADDDMFDEPNEEESPLALLSVEQEDLAQDITWRIQNEDKLKNHFEDSKEQVQIQKYSAKPLKLARSAYNKLLGIRLDSDELDDPDLDSVLGRIIKVVNGLRDAYKKKRQTNSKCAKTTKRKGKVSPRSGTKRTSSTKHSRNKAR